jgi:hypothetical protein
MLASLHQKGLNFKVEARACTLAPDGNRTDSGDDADHGTVLPENSCLPGALELG